MVKLPAGSFQMGSPAGQGDSDEYGPGGGQVTVELSGFSIGKYEVTNAQYAAFLTHRKSNDCGETTCVEEGSGDLLIEHTGSTWTPKEGKEDYPVVEVSWYGAKAFADWAGLKLPTEAQWEYACRAGRQQTWAGTDDQGKLGEYANLSSSLAQVDSRKGNAWGVKDLSGNVWEWTADWYASYSADSASDPKGPPSGEDRVNRGGGAWLSADGARCALRNWGGLGGQGSSLGLRVARPSSLPPPRRY